jgi:hypothetical protein
MAKFKVGDRFIPRKPKDGFQEFGWDEGMNKFDGKILTVYGISENGWIEAEECIWYFNPDWCEKVEEMVYDTKNLGFEIIVNARGEKEMIITDCELFNKRFREEFEKSREIRPSIKKPIPDKLIDWEQRRYELAKEFMGQLVEVFNGNCNLSNISIAIKLADEMIKQLNKES